MNKRYENVNIIECKGIDKSRYNCTLYRRVPEGHLERISTVRANKIIAIAPGGFKADKANDELNFSYSNGKCMLDIIYAEKILSCYETK